MAKSTKSQVASWVNIAIGAAGLLLGAGLTQMLMYMSKWKASESGSIYDLIMTGLVALSFMVFGVGIVVLAYVAYRVRTEGSK
jgi:ABC-type Fe3+ transport system permease subunit